ncbi:hypothetical protein RYA97_19105 [Pseudomonas syringae group sp. 26L6]|uniref:hypothetical protein n=1 Tax=Pseudomonas syringae group sp. 26L6 TaxID=3079591 RepID=UPI00290CBCB6|nr:hypothetical protein [Pseudomonas syringae group sp. 26L6]MDU8647213.1 hypothetical protein [Pseudomonas syringae group sp. 26L6]
MISSIFQKISGFISRNLRFVSFGAIGSALVYGSTYFQPEIKTVLFSRKADVEILTPKASVDLYRDVPLTVRVDSTGISDLSPGTITIYADSEFFKVGPPSTVKVEKIVGSMAIIELPAVKAIKVSPTKVKVYAQFVSGDLKVNSNALMLDIVQPEAAENPHFDHSDTNRVVLSGTWRIDVGGQTGSMLIKQGADNQIRGSYFLPGYRWPSGDINGYKDGATFRVTFNIPGKGKEEILRVAGFFEIKNKDGDYIEILGCAYHLQRATTRYKYVGAQGADCDKPAFYDQWKTLQSFRFDATAKFSKDQ